MKKRTSQLGRLVAAITLPFVMGACMSWQQQELTGLRDVVTRDQPEKIRVSTRITGNEREIKKPTVSGDTIYGLHDGNLVRIPFAIVTNVSVPKDGAPSTAHGQELIAGGSIRVRPSQPPETGGQWTAEPHRRWADATVVRLTPDSLWYESGGDVAALSVEAVEVRRPTLKDQRWLGMGLGGVLGGVIGAVVGTSMSPGDQFRPTYPEAVGCRGSGFFSRSCTSYGPLVYEQYDSSTDDILGASVVGVLAGGGLGYLAGKMFRRWETVELDQLTVGAGNLAVSMSIRR